MVIQRIQSLFLLIAALLMVLVCFVVPVAEISSPDGPSANVYITSLLPLLILNLLTAALLLLDIFLYKKLNFQIKVAKISVVLTVISAILEAFVLYSQTQTIEVKWVGSALMIGAALVFGLLAINGMNSDRKLLRSYDRLR